jgi:hypothetical protein
MLALSACAIPTSRSNIVVITEAQTVVEGCQRLGVIDGGSPLRQVLLVDQQREAALSRLKIAAAEMGGTHVLTPIADIKWKGPDTSGTVFKCVRR